MFNNPISLFGIISFGIAAVFFCAFALKIALLEHRDQQTRSGGFQVKLNTGKPPVTLRKDNDHG